MLIVIVTVAMAFNFRKIIEFIEYRKKAKILSLVDALNCKQVEGLTKEHLQEELVREHFKLTTGIGVEKEFREAIIEAHKRGAGSVNFLHFKRALPHLKCTENTLSVNISCIEKFLHVFNIVFGFVLLLLSLFLMFIPSQMGEATLLQLFWVLGMGGFVFVISLFMLYQTVPVLSAKYIATVLENIDNK